MYTDEQKRLARIELAKRELARRQEDSGQPTNEMQEDESSHPFLRMIAGLTNAGRNVANLPHEQVKSLEDVFGNLGKNFEGLPGPKIQGQTYKPISSYLPQDTHDYADIYGLKGEGNLMEHVLQKGFEHAPEIASIGSLGRQVLRRYPITNRMATRQLRESQNLLNEIGFPHHAGISNAQIERAMPFLPNTHATEQMLAGVREGNYAPSFSLQSQVGHHARTLQRSPLPADRLISPVGRELKQDMLGNMETALRSHAHEDPRFNRAADLLRGGIRDYRTYMQYRENVVPYLKKIGIPTSLIAGVAFGFKKGKKAVSDLID